MSPGKDGEKLPPYPNLHMYPPHHPSPSIREDPKDDADFMAACHSEFTSRLYEMA